MATVKHSSLVILSFLSHIYSLLSVETVLRILNLVRSDTTFLTPPPPDCDGWLGTTVASPSSTSTKDCGRSKLEEESACCEQRSITETVINGSMKETVSLTVDAKTETAVFKRFATSTRKASSKWLNFIGSSFSAEVVVFLPGLAPDTLGLEQQPQLHSAAVSNNLIKSVHVFFLYLQPQNS